MKIALSLAVILGIGGGAFYFWKSSVQRSAGASDSGRQSTAAAELRDIQFAVTAAGEIGPADQVSVRPEVNGRIAELPVDIGDKVSRGQLLCRLDDQDLQIEHSSRLTEIDGAKLQLQKARRNFVRAKTLAADSLISQEVFDDARTDFDLATNALIRAEKSLRLVEDRLSKTKILAPFDCTVLTRPVSIGQAVSGSAGFNSGTEVMTIANLNDMIINAHINQADIIRLQHGQQVHVQIESVPGLQLSGVVERIAPQALVKNGIKGFSARIVLRNLDPVVRPGMTAILNIPIASAESVLAIPLSAIFTEQGARFAFVKKGDLFERRPVTIGLTDYSFAEVRNGLAEGEVVSLEQPPEAARLPEAAPLAASGVDKAPNKGSVALPASGGAAPSGPATARSAESLPRPAPARLIRQGGS